VHVYGSATGELTRWCTSKGISLHVFDWRSEHELAGLAQNGFYLLRPDSYIALADPTGSPRGLDRYLAEKQINIGTSRANDSPPVNWARHRENELRQNPRRSG
jgi:hypothetical protein